MTWKKCLMVLATLALFSAPTWAGSFGVYGAYWGAEDAANSWGAGARVGFNFAPWVELEFHGTYFPDFHARGNTIPDTDVRAIPVDGGIKFNLLSDKFVNPYVGGGVSYYFLNSDVGNIDNDTGIYGEVGVDIGKDNTRFFAEALWRQLETPISFGSFDDNIDFGGIDWHAGAVFRWGK
ncbi:MAG TPA: outer membrane beta-barrel protein [Candidatus Polarisedimenticolia bacterium]|jgi:hypothetical protein|nr:outer membrane beta-barrel protein [Candidatus Polarisedimenticolia bacterium]